MTFWDTMVIGEVAELGRHEFLAEDIKRFAATYDPQVFHLDEEAARRSVLGGLCASGWHTAAVFMRLNILHRDRQVRDWIAAGHPVPKLGPSPGVKNIRWIRPVYAGDVIAYRQSVTAKRVSASRPGWGVAQTEVEATNEAGKLVFSMEGAVFVGTD